MVQTDADYWTPRKSFDALAESLKAANKSYRLRLENELEKRPGYISRVRKNLFRYPNFVAKAFATFCVLELIFVASISNILADIDGQLFASICFLLLTLVVVSVSLLLVAFTPSDNTSFEERWTTVVRYLACKLNLYDPDILKAKLNSTRGHYKRKGARMLYVIHFTNGLFFALLNEDFLVAVWNSLMNGTLEEMLRVSVIKSLLLLALAVLGLCYLFLYGYKIAWLSNAISCIPDWRKVSHGR